jgi:hypothetical protein
MRVRLLAVRGDCRLVPIVALPFRNPATISFPLERGTRQA